MTESPEWVFVVDDDLSVREALSSLIRSVGLRVETYPSAAAFLEAERPPGVACLILDVRMPGLSGLVLQSRMAQSGPAIPIIFITGHGDIPMAVRAMRAGALDFLQKPFNDQVLTDWIHSAIARREATAAAQRANSLLPVASCESQSAWHACALVRQCDSAASNAVRASGFGSGFGVGLGAGLGWASAR